MPSKTKTVTQLADDFVGKFGSAPGSREWDFMAHAFIKGYRACERRWRNEKRAAGDHSKWSSPQGKI